MKWFPNGFGTRASLAFALVLASCGVFVSSVVVGFMTGDWSFTKQTATSLLSLTAMAIGFYFRDRQTQDR